MAATDVDYGPPPRPAWRAVDGSLVDCDDLRGDDVEIDLTGAEPAVRKQFPELDHPWASNWPTWIAL